MVPDAETTKSTWEMRVGVGVIGSAGSGGDGFVGVGFGIVAIGISPLDCLDIQPANSQSVPNDGPGPGHRAAQ